jgi:putative aldouronate transport system permease protein
MSSKRMDTPAYRVFIVLNHVLLILMAILCILPLINVLSVSFSAPNKATAGLVRLWPVDFTTSAYAYVLKDHKFWTAMWIAIERTVLGTAIGLFLTATAAYPLSKDRKMFKARKYYVWYFFFTMLFSGGLIPGFLTVYYTGLLDSIWALVIPSAVSVWNIILMLNFFRQLPKELEEAAYIDGAGHFKILWMVVLPISKPVLATVALFTMVGHWNAWFDGMLYMRKSIHYPLQTYLYSLLSVDVARFLTQTQLAEMQKVSTKTLNAAQIFIGAFPILVVYPFLQKYFTKGLVLGSVKG